MQYCGKSMQNSTILETILRGVPFDIKDQGDSTVARPFPYMKQDLKYLEILIHSYSFRSRCLVQSMPTPESSVRNEENECAETTTGISWVCSRHSPVSILGNQPGRPERSKIKQAVDRFRSIKPTMIVLWLCMSAKPLLLFNLGAGQGSRYKYDRT